MSSTAPPPPPPPPPPSGMLSGPPPPPPLFGGATPVPDLPQINIPRPRSRMKSLQWQKIPANNVIGKSNLWTIIGHLDNKFDMDYEKMEELFSLNHETGPKRGSDDADGVPESKKKREHNEGQDSLPQVNLLDGKRSLNVNIFLKQFRMEHEAIVQLIRDGHCEKLGAERLRSLLKLLPSQEEIDSINGFAGDVEQLGNAEKFFVCLMKLPNYRMRIEGLLIMEEFNLNMEWIRPSIEAVIQAARDLQENQSLKELIYLILISGNYLNSGNYAGNAAGFKLSSLLKITEIRANKPGMNLMHYVAQEAEMKNPKLLRFPDEMKFLKDASQVSVDALVSDISNISTKVRAITKQIVVAGADFQHQMEFFLKEANIEVAELEEDISDIDLIRVELSTFFCEDIKTFKLEECFRVMQTFCERLKKATEENVQRRIQEAKAENRRKSKEYDIRRNSKDVAELLDQAINSDEGSVVDMLLADVRSGYTSRKFNVGNISVTKVTKVSLSPAAGNVSEGIDMPDGSGNQHRTSTGGSPSNGPFSPSDPLSQRRNRRSNATSDDETLINFLTKSTESLAEPEKPESRFERYSSLRRRRLERKGKRNILEVFETGRERAPSPNLADMKTTNTSSDSAISGVKMRHSSNATRDRPKSEVFSDDRENSRTLRRSQSVLDKSFIGSSNSEHARKNYSDDSLDESDALIRRLKQRLNRKSGRDTPPINEEGDDGAMRGDRKSSSEQSTLRSNSRWRSGIALSDTNLSMNQEPKTNPTSDSNSSLDHPEPTQNTQEKLSNRAVENPDSEKLNQSSPNLDSSSSSEALRNQQNDSGVTAKAQISVSMRKKISSGMGTDIDGVLKTIEDTGRQIDTIGVTGPIRRTQDPSSSINPAQVAVVAHVSAQNTHVAPAIIEADLKSKENNNKNVSRLSVEKPKPTRNMSDSRKDIKRASSANSTIARTRSASSIIKRTVSKPKTPPPPQIRLCKSRARAENENLSGNNNVINKKDTNKNAKPASRKNSQAGGDLKNTTGRSQTNTDSKHPVHPLKDDNGLSSNTSGGDSGKTSVVKRKATNKPSEDGRRHGLLFPENDTNPTFDSFSHESLQSTNTSTETLQSDINASENENSPLFQSIKVRKRNNNVEESESPLAEVAKWKQKRAQQRLSMSMTDIMNDNSSNNRDNSNSQNNNLTNDAGSRFSYASSNDRDEGFETASGSLSQRTSMNSNLEAEIHKNSALSRLAEMARNNDEYFSNSSSELNVKMKNNSVNSKANNWTDQTDSFNNTNDELPLGCLLSPDNSSKENVFSDDNVPASNHSKSSQAQQQTNASSVKKATPQAKSTKQQAVPGYMLPTDSSSSKPSRSRASSTTGGEVTTPTFNRSTPGRSSARDPENGSTFKRDFVRASLRGDAFQRGTTARTSVRGPRTLNQSNPANSTLAAPSPSRSRSESNSSISSKSSSTSNIYLATSSSASGTSRQRLVSTSSTGAPIYRPTTPSGRSTPSARPTTPSFQTSNSSTRPAKATAASSFTRSQSMRAVSGSISSENITRHKTPTSTADGRRSTNSTSQNGRRSVTPLTHEHTQSTTSLLQERPHSTTPMLSEGRSTKRLSFMSPTASSRAKADDSLSAVPTRTQSLISIASDSSFPHHTSLRTQNKSSTSNGRKSPAPSGLFASHKPDHYQSLSTVAEQTADEDREAETPKKSPHITKRVLVIKKASPAGSKSSGKSSGTASGAKK